MPGPTTEAGGTGAARRQIENRGTAVTVIDKYRQYVGEDEYNDTVYNTYFFERWAGNAIIQRASDFEREYLGGNADTQTAFFYLTPPNRSGEPAIRDIPEAVPPDERLSGGADPSKDEYGATRLRDDVNADPFIANNLITEQSGVRRVQAGLLDSPLQTAERP